MTLTFRATQVLDATLTLNLDIATIPAGSAAETTFKVRRWSLVSVDFRISANVQAVNIDIDAVKAAFAEVVDLPVRPNRIACWLG